MSCLTSDLRGVPGLVDRVVASEVVVVGTHRHEELGPHLDVQIHQASGIPLVDHPVLADVLVAVGGRIAEVADVVVEVGRPLLIHVVGVPVALLGHGLRIPVRPRAELGVAPPLGRGIGQAQRLPVGGVGTRRDGKRRQVPDVRRQPQVAGPDDHLVDVDGDVTGGPADDHRRVGRNGDADDGVEEGAREGSRGVNVHLDGGLAVDRHADRAHRRRRVVNRQLAGGRRARDLSALPGAGQADRRASHRRAVGHRRRAADGRRFQRDR